MCSCCLSVCVYVVARISFVRHFDALLCFVRPSCRALVRSYLLMIQRCESELRWSMLSLPATVHIALGASKSASTPSSRANTVIMPSRVLICTPTLRKQCRSPKKDFNNATNTKDTPPPKHLMLSAAPYHHCIEPCVDAAQHLEAQLGE